MLENDGSAFAHLQALIDRNSASLEENLDRLWGHDWFQLSLEEASVFPIQIQDVPRLVAVFDAYEAVVDITSNDIHADHELCEAVRAELPWLTTKQTDIGEFQNFAALFGIFYRLAHAFFTKIEFWQIRQGIACYKDENQCCEITRQVNKCR